MWRSGAEFAGPAAVPLPQASGTYRRSVFVTNTTAALTQDRLFFVPFYVPTSTAFDRIGVEVSSGTASATPRFGVYASNANGLPTGAPLVDAGTVDASTNGVKEITISLTLASGLYYLAFVNQGAAATVRVGWCVIPNIASATATAVSNSSNAAITQASVSGALPTVGTLSFTTNTESPVIILRAA